MKSRDKGYNHIKDEHTYTILIDPKYTKEIYNYYYSLVVFLNQEVNEVPQSTSNVVWTIWLLRMPCWKAQILLLSVDLIPYMW